MSTNTEKREQEQINESALMQEINSWGCFGRLEVECAPETKSALEMK